MRWQDRIWFHTRKPTDARRDVRGTCIVCGRATRFLYSSWSIPPRMLGDLRDDALRDAYRVRESMWCSHCGSSTRERGFWSVLLLHYGTDARTVSELVDEPAFGALRIAEINRLNAGHEALARAPGVVYSEYPEQDIQRLTYEDRSFDLVLTSDTLEHVPDYRAALRETRRVLRAGGRHILTIPLRPDLSVSRNRHGMTAIYHGEAPGPLRLLRRPTEDMRCLHDFAMDAIDDIRDAGFEVELHGDGIESVICARAI